MKTMLGLVCALLTCAACGPAAPFRPDPEPPKPPPVWIEKVPASALSLSDIRRVLMKTGTFSVYGYVWTRPTGCPRCAPGNACGRCLPTYWSAGPRPRHSTRAERRYGGLRLSLMVDTGRLYLGAAYLLTGHMIKGASTPTLAITAVKRIRNPPPPPGPLLSVAELFKLAPQAQPVLATAYYLAKPRKCRPCPPRVVCKPCAPPLARFADDDGSASRWIFVEHHERCRPLHLGHRYVLAGSWSVERGISRLKVTKCLLVGVKGTPRDE